MQLNDLTAISPIDGRYRNKVESLAPYFSEYALIRYRVKVEVLYFIALCEIPLPQLKGVDSSKFPKLMEIYENFDEADALKIKEIEKVTNHDVKAVEYFIKEKFDNLGLADFKEFIHFGLTSQDINNTSIPLSTKDALVEVFIPYLDQITALITNISKQWSTIPMLAKTHGQPASPTRLGKEVEVFVKRLSDQIDLLKTTAYAAKFGGATGNFNAHFVAYPNYDWHAFGDQFVAEKLGLKRSFPTTQIEHYDHFAALFDAIKRINTILLDFSKDVWQYVSMNYFKQKINPNEVGSSAMPHKVNPIDFENAEGNLGIANALFEHLSAKLPISRLQRDLTDSTVLRNVGVPVAHTLLALSSLKKGINKLEVNEEAIRKDLDDNWAVVAEAIQTILRREAYPNPYEALKALTRTGDKITKETLHVFIDELDISDAIKDELRKITPFNYTGK
ncbi:adenylosuccinate lyase [Marinoscillum sp.]|uniref:adenylosuccinate lyase n=1 Tax=Marinoscillum sp. TaxID=2024838 RepID=UPI003BAC610A